jgi:hypothetical protein
MPFEHNVPQFPLIANIWRFGNAPPNLPDVITPAQLHVGVQMRQIQGLATFSEGMITRFIYAPKGTDIRPFWRNSNDFVELPAGSGRFYSVMDVDDVAKGFPNEFRIGLLIVTQTFSAQWPFPIP